MAGHRGSEGIGGVSVAQSRPKAIGYCVAFIVLSGFSLASDAATESAVTIGPSGAELSTPLPATLVKPEGQGPFPAVVIMHDCSGLGPRSSGSPRRWANELVSRGYVVLMPDSFTNRGHPDGVCVNPSPNRLDVAPARRVADAYAALAYLRTLPYVDGARVGLMGGSHGGTTTLASMVAPESDNEPLARDKRAGFVGAVALYPGCGAPLGNWRTRRQAKGGPFVGHSGVYKPAAPVLILTGGSDDWTPAEPCRKLVESAQQSGYPMAIKVYPGAHHAFDSDRPVRYVAGRVNANAPGGRGATTGGDPAAWADSIREVGAFFDRQAKSGN